jgi:hypothetical protein
MTSNLISMTIILAVLLWMIQLNYAHAQLGYWTQDAHRIQYTTTANGYWAYQWRHGGGDDITDMLQNQRNTEAIINEMRAARGQPPCSIGLLGQWQGRPRCP